MPGVKLTTYSSCISPNTSYKDLIDTFDTKDACTVYIGHGRFQIFYNDMDKALLNSNRVRWSLAHELGHIQLKHHQLLATERLARGGITDKKYKQVELEADYFAQLILVPHIVLNDMRIYKRNEIEKICKLSTYASNFRIKDYNTWVDNQKPLDSYELKLRQLFYDFSNKCQCSNCKSIVITNYKDYCPICGNKYTLKWSNAKDMIYDSLECYSNGKLKECPICNNETTDYEGNFCQICGTVLVNYCTNANCAITLPTNARYCPVCGSGSTFFNNDILKAWNFDKNNSVQPIMDYFEEQIDEELPFN